MTDDPTVGSWMFLSELVRQLDDGTGRVTGRTVATTLNVDDREAERLIKLLRRRGLVEVIENDRVRLGSRFTDRRLEVTPAGMQASAAGRIPG